jgi:hypothetical protein
MKYVTYLALAAVLVISACSSSGGGTDNPILGKWTAADRSGFMVPSDVEFTPTEQVNGPNERYAVSYTFKDGVVEVMPRDGSALPRQCKLRDQNTLECNAMGIPMVFTRIK